MRLLQRIAPRGRPEVADPRHDYVGSLLAFLVAGPGRAMRAAAALAFPPLPTLAAMYGEAPSRRLYLRYVTRPFRPIGHRLRRT